MNFLSKLFHRQKKVPYSLRDRSSIPDDGWWRIGVSPHVADDWETAETLFQAQEWEKALRAYGSLTGKSDPKSKAIITAELMAMTKLRQAVILTRLNELEEAQTYLDHLIVKTAT